MKTNNRNVNQIFSDNNQFIRMAFGSRQKAEEVINGLMGFDVEKSQGMSVAEFSHHYARRNPGWKRA